MNCIIDKYFPKKEKRYFKVLNIDEGYDNFEEVDSFEAIDHEDAAEKYCEEYYNKNIGDWEQESEITVEVCEIFKERPDDRRKEHPIKFEISYTFYPSFSASEIIDDEEFFGNERIEE